MSLPVLIVEDDAASGAPGVTLTAASSAAAAPATLSTSSARFWASASAAPPASAAATNEIASGARFEEATQGAPFDISLHKYSVTYCDENFKHALRLWPNSGKAVDGFCRPARKPNTSCAGVAGVTSVRAPGGSPDDVLETKDSSVKLKGHVRDCAGAESTAVVATSAGVIVVDTVKGIVTPART